MYVYYWCSKHDISSFNKEAELVRKLTAPKLEKRQDDFRGDNLLPVHVVTYVTLERSVEKYYF